MITVPEYLKTEQWKKALPDKLPEGKVYPSLVVMAVAMTLDDAEARTSPRLFQPNGIMMSNPDEQDSTNKNNTDGQVWIEVVPEDGALLYLKTRPLQLFGEDVIDASNTSFNGVVRESIHALVDWLDEFKIAIPYHTRDHVLALEAILIEFNVTWINQATRKQP